MSVSECLKLLAKGAPTLWINSRLRAISFFVASALIAACIYGLEAMPASRLLAYAHPMAHADDWERASARLAQAIATKADIVLLTGGSTAREFTGPNAYLSRTLSNACGRPILFVNAGTSSQNITETWSLAAAVPPDRLALLVVGMNYFRFESSKSDILSAIVKRHIVFAPPSNMLKVISKKIGVSTERIPLPHALGWIANHGDAFHWRLQPPDFESLLKPASEPFSDVTKKYPDRPLSDARKTAITSRYIAERMALFERNHQMNRDLWISFASHMRAKHVPLTFVALPESASMKPVDHLMGATFRFDMDRLRVAGAQVEDWRFRLQLVQRDFYDQQHLLSSGRQAIEPHFIALMLKALPHCKATAQPQ